MKIISILTEIVDLLKESNCPEPAKWYEEKIQHLKAAEPKSADFKKIIEEIENTLGGMGSFSDLSLNPSKNSKFTREQARNKQWELVEEFDKEVERINYKQTESGKKMFIRLYELAKATNDQTMVNFCKEVLKTFDKHDINGYIPWKE